MSPESVAQRSGRKRSGQETALCLSVVLGLSLLILSLFLVDTAGASGPEDEPGPEDVPVIGLASDALECLAVGAGPVREASGIVHLSWPGQAERARLILDVSGSEAPHTVRVNGKPVASVPVYPQGQPCGDGETFYLDVPPEILVQGDNRIEITNDALPEDSWTASQVRLEVIGHFTISPPAGPGDSDGVGAADLAAAQATSYTIRFINPYDGSSQDARVVDASGGAAVPLVIYVHGRGSHMYEGEETIGGAIEDKGWLLASPQLHGSWPDPPDPPGKYAYASLESQYDIIGTLNYMLGHFNVITDQIYLVGYSMGGQIDTVTAAKFPHVFAAVFDNKGPTDMTIWYWEQWEKTWMERECHIDGDPKTPAENLFCYQRRSGLNFANNYVHVPISITHSVSDALVPIHHSWDLRDAINSYDPDRQAVVYEDTLVGPTCPPNYHCYEPEPMAVLDFLEQFTLNNNPTYVNITTDESKSYHWMNVAQTGGDHWSHVEATYYPVTATVAATISDTDPLTVAFNLGSVALRSTSVNEEMKQPGMGLPATTYLVRGGGSYRLADYASGYLTVTMAHTGQFTLSISALEAELMADPPIVPGYRSATSMVTAVIRDRLYNPVPGGTVVEFLTSEGVFPNGGMTYTTTVRTGGQATATLMLTPPADLAMISASVGSITASTAVDVIHPAIDLAVAPDRTTVFSGQSMTYTYQVTNTGDITLTGVTVVDDSGPVCGDVVDIVLAAEATHGCTRRAQVTQTTTLTATVTGQDPLGYLVTKDASATVVVAPRTIYMPIVTKSCCPL